MGNLLKGQVVIIINNRKGLSHGMKSVHRTLFLTAFRPHRQ